MSDSGADFRTVLVDLDEHVLTVTLNRPERMNSFTEAMVDDFAEIWRRCRDEDDIHVVVLRAAGDRAWSTGIDMHEGAWWQWRPVFHHEDPGAVLGPKSQHVWKPVIAAVHGMAAGGAFYWLNECDFLVCSDDATFFDPHLSGGMVAALEPIGLVKRGAPVGDVLRWALTGSEERITAETALRLGIVTEVVARDVLWEHVDGIAKQIAARRPLAVQGTVRAIWESLDLPPTLAKRMGLSYTQLGNPQSADDLGARPRETRYR